MAAMKYAVNVSLTPSRSKAALLASAVGDHSAHVRFHHGQHMRRCLLREHHVLGDLTADGRVLESSWSPACRAGQPVIHAGAAAAALPPAMAARS